MTTLQINTAQNVNISFELATLGHRVLAFILDNVLKAGYWFFAIYFLGASRLFESTGGDFWSTKAIYVLALLPITFYSLYSEILMNGQTLGKMAMRIRVINIEGFKPSTSDYIIRWFLRIVDFNFFSLLAVYMISLDLVSDTYIGIMFTLFVFGKFVGFISILSTKNSQRLGDISANTVVILLKDNAKFSQTISEDLQESYTPAYPNVIRFSDNDARIIKDTFVVASRKRDRPEADNIYTFRNYISYTTSGVISTHDVFEINFTKTIDQWEQGDELPENLISIQPKTQGKTFLKNGNTIHFVPEKPLKPDTEYSITLAMKKVFKEVEAAKETYTFQCKTIKPNFTIDINELQSYDKDWQFVEGTLKSADIIALEAAKKLIAASQEGKDLHITWNESFEHSRYFNFRLDSIQRTKENSEALVSWNGRAIQSDTKGKEILAIPGKDNFRVTKVTTAQNDKHISINFSDPIDKSQNFRGLVSIQNITNPRFVVDGNVLKVFHHSELTGTVALQVFGGIKNTEGYKLKEPYSETLTFEVLKPQVRLLNAGNILPNSSQLKFNFEAVNLSAVDIRVIKVFNDNVLQFLQYNNLNGHSEIKRVGRRIVKKTMHLMEDASQNTKNWKAYAVDLSRLFKADPGAIYRVEISFKKEYSLYECDGGSSFIKTAAASDEFYDEEDEREEQYWDDKLYSYRNYSYNWRQRDNPCHEAYYSESRIISQNLVASNIGVIAKRGNQNNYFFAVSDILTAQPISGAAISLYNYQQQKFHQVTTNSRGIAQYQADREAHFAIVRKNNNITYIKLNDGSSLSLSKFDVSGVKTQKGIKGFIYGERGVWRPGDSIHLNFVLNDNENKLPEDHPVKLEVRDPDGKLIYKKVSREHTNRFYAFPFTTATENTTGVYRAVVSVGGAKFYKSLKVETIKPNRLKINLDFDKEVFSADEALQGKLQVNWLHGTPARNVRAEVQAKVVNTTTVFKGYEKYLFNDPTQNYYTEELTLFDGQVNENGSAEINKKPAIGKNAPGMLRVNFLVKAFEDGGDFSIDAFSKKYAPYTSFVGMQSPEEDEYNSYTTGTAYRFDIATLTALGKPVARKDVVVKIYRIEWRWWWNSGRDNLSNYHSDTYHRPYKTITLNTAASGKGNFEVRIPKEDRGRYLVRVIDPVSGHATGRTMYFYDNWWENTPTDDKEAAKMLIFNADKESYQVGETARVTFPSAYKAKAFVSLENGSEVVEHRWIDTKKGKTVIEIKITEKMAPNFFVNISLLQPHAKVENDLPMRLYGLIPIIVEDPNTRLKPQISMPGTLEPEKEFEVVVSEKKNQPMTYTLAIVEEGLLDLTRFKTPNPHQSFYAREALGVRTWDIYDHVIGAYTGSIDQVFAIGGDGTTSAAKNRKANRFKPVVTHIGPFTLGAGKKKTHKVTLPNYMGSVRAMVVAGNAGKEAYGNTEKTVPVKKPLMVLASVPRKLSPGEKVVLPVTVFATDNTIKEATVQLKLSKGIEAVGAGEKQLSFTTPGEQMAYFNLDVSKANGINTIEVIATSGLKTARYKVELDVENPNPVTTQLMNKTLQANETLDIDFSTFGVTGSNSASIQVSTLPPMDFERRMEYLIRYPHGCVEQTTSSVFPQLFLGDLFDISSEKKNRVEKNIKNGIKRLGYFQRPNGGLSYWMGEPNGNDWGTSYAGHFMFEAEKKGFVLPFGFKKSWVRYQKEAAGNWRPNPGYSNDLNQAYRLYTLALSGNADLGAMNRLREYDAISNEAKWRLAATYALIGQKEASRELANTSSIEFKKRNYYYSYGSVTRNKAMALETMILLDDDRTIDFAKSIAKDLSSDQWMSTQTTAYSLLAMSKLLIKNGGKAVNLTYEIKGKKEGLTSKKSMAERDLPVSEGENQITISNLENNTVYISIITKGKLPLGNELPISRGFSATVSYTYPNGSPIDIGTIQQGQGFMATVTVKNLKNEAVNDVALTQLFPSGWEIVNTRFTDFGSTVSSKARHTDIRDDRVYFYFDMGSRGSRNSEKTFTVMLNASYLGAYYLPGLQVEAMYDNDYLVRNKGQRVKVVK